MKDFPMSCFVNKEEMYKAKAKYYESLFRNLGDYLVTIETLRYDKEVDNYYEISSGDYVDEFITKGKVSE